MTRGRSKCMTHTDRLASLIHTLCNNFLEAPPCPLTLSFSPRIHQHSVPCKSFMSLSHRTLRKLRIIAVPLTRPKAHSIRAPTEAKKMLTYYQFQMSSPKLSSKEGEGKVEEKPKSGWLPNEGVAQFLQNKAAETWNGFGKKKEGSWQVRFLSLSWLLFAFLSSFPSFWLHHMCIYF